MKGAVFTILQEMVEEQAGIDVWDSLIQSCDLPSKGIYTSAATYDDDEILQLVAKLAEATNTPAPELLKSFGSFLFGKLHASLPPTVELPDNFFDYMEKVDSVIHVEVKKLDREAITPEVSVLSRSNTTLTLRYCSARQLCHLAIGLIQGAADYFDERISIAMPICTVDGHDHCQLVIDKQ